jgi:diguanylate cyclase
MPKALNKLTVETRIARGMLAVGALLGAAVLASYFIKVSADKVEELGSASLSRAAELDRALISMLDAEARQRGYVITGLDDYLQPYEGARIRASKALTNLRYVYANNAETLHDIEQLASLAEKNLARLEAGVEARRTQGEDAARRLLLEDAGRGYIEQIQGALARLKLQEGDTYAALAQLSDQRRTALIYAEVLVLLLIVGVGVVAYRSLVSEARQRQLLSEQLERQALHDPLTALPNRRHFADELERSISRAARKGDTRAVLFIDLDGFKRINDELGHQAGDELLVQVATTFERVVRKGDFVARLGSDEFAVLVEDPGQDGAVVLARRLIASIEVPLLAHHPQHRISASVGIAMHPSDGSDAAGLLSKADAAMYRAKHDGKGTVRSAADVEAEPPA